MMIRHSFPTAVALCAALSFVAHAGEPDPKGPCFSYDIVGIGSIGAQEEPRALEIQGDHAYICTANNLYVMDIAQSDAFSLVGMSELYAYTPESLTLNEGHAYLKYGNGFGIWNIEDPTDPWFVRSYSPAQSIENLVLVGDGLMTAGSTVIDIDYPYAPARDAVADGADQILLHLEDNLVLSDDMVVWDLTDPYSPVPLNEPQFGAVNADQIVAEGDYYYARQSRYLYVYRRTGTASFNEITRLTLSSQYIVDLEIRGSIMAVLENGLYFYDISNTSNNTEPQLLGHIQYLYNADTGAYYGEPSAFAYHNDKLYVATYGGHLFSLNIHTNPLGTHHTLDQALETKLIDNLALVADNAAGLQIFDITDPSRPVLSSTYPTANTAVAVDAIPGIAFVATHQAGLDIVDISDPERPTLLSHFDTPRTVRDVKIVGDLAYVLDRIYGLYILDISDPAKPVVVSNLDTPGYAENITVADDLAIVAQGAYDTQIIDVSDTANPVIVSTIPPSTNASGVHQTAVQDDLLYVADRTEGYRVFDLSNPAAPVLLGMLNPLIDDDGATYALLPQGNLLYVANWNAGLTTLDNSNPLDPRVIANYPTSGDALNLTARGNLMFVSADDAGLQIFDLANCAAPCAADLNGDTVLDFFDISAFLVAFNEHAPLADLNDDGEFNFFDVSAMLVAFQAGCP